ncbi:MAG: molybdopterin-dependent oxidoreductase [Eggerthellaceae bacterium]|nr:molybdopterin-dependent oxidoreductase [Eggerthellaceae bacterium]
MTKAKSSQGGLTRRGFLKTTAAVAGATAVVGSASLTALAAGEEAADAAAEQVFHSGCRGNCGSKCHQKVVVRDGKVVQVSAMDYPEGDEGWRRLCVKGYTQPQRQYDPDRVKYPMRRVEGTERGAGQWERITWEEAIGMIAQNMGTALATYGPTSLAVMSSYASYGVLHGAMGGYMSFAYGRFLTGLGATVFGACADVAQIQVQMMALGHNGNSYDDVVNAKTVVAWGGRPDEAAVHSWHFVCDARENGTKLITIDPQYSPCAAHSDWYRPIRPGTDGALMLGMINYIEQNGLVDEEYMSGLTQAPFLVAEGGAFLRMSAFGVEPTPGPINPMTGAPTVIDPVLVYDEADGTVKPLDEAAQPAIRGEYVAADGKAYKTCYQECLSHIGEYTLERASEITGIAVEDIAKLAEIYAQGGVFNLGYQGLGHHVNSHHNYKNLALLHAQTGNYGRPGTAIVQNTSPFTGISNYIPFFYGVTGPSIPNMSLPEVVATGKWGATDVNLQVLWVCNGNPLCCESGRLEMIEAFKKVPFVVTADVSMTDTAMYSDLVLPVPHIYEIEDYDSGCPTPYLMYFQKCVDPLYESKADLDIMRMVASALGLDALYDNGASDADFIRKIVEGDTTAMLGVTYEKLASGDMVRSPLSPVSHVEMVVGPTESARMKFYLEYPTPRANYGQAVADYEHYPYYTNPAEAYWDNPLRKEYPLLGCSEHHKYHVHSQTAFTPWLRELEPEPVLKINAQDAADRGISQGDYVRAFNERGDVVLRALVTDGIMQGAVGIPHGFREDQYVSGHAQNLTSRVMDDFIHNSAFYDFLCQVEKYEGSVK